MYSIFTRITSRVSESEITYNLVILQAAKLTKLIEDVLYLGIDDNVHKKDYDQLSLKELTNSLNEIYTQDGTIVSYKCFIINNYLN